MVGFDTDKKNVFEDIADFAIKAKIDLPQISVYTPFPGTQAFNRLDKQGRIISYNWEKYDAKNVIFQPSHMSPEELMEGYKYIWKRCYSLKAILKRLWGRPFLVRPIILITNLYFIRFMKKQFAIK